MSIFREYFKYNKYYISFLQLLQNNSFNKIYSFLESESVIDFKSYSTLKIPRNFF